MMVDCKRIIDKYQKIPKNHIDFICKNYYLRLLSIKNKLVVNKISYFFESLLKTEPFDFNRIKGKIAKHPKNDEIYKIILKYFNNYEVINEILEHSSYLWKDFKEIDKILLPYNLFIENCEDISIDDIFSNKKITVKSKFEKALYLKNKHKQKFDLNILLNNFSEDHVCPSFYKFFEHSDEFSFETIKKIKLPSIKINILLKKNDEIPAFLKKNFTLKELSSMDWNFFDNFILDCFNNENFLKEKFKLKHRFFNKYLFNDVFKKSISSSFFKRKRFIFNKNNFYKLYFVSKLNLTDEQKLELLKYENSYIKLKEEICDIFKQWSFTEIKRFLSEEKISFSSLQNADIKLLQETKSFKEYQIKMKKNEINDENLEQKIQFDNNVFLDYEIYVPRRRHELVEASILLKNCLSDCKFVKKIKNGKINIVFLKKNNVLEYAVEFMGEHILQARGFKNLKMNSEMIKSFRNFLCQKTSSSRQNSQSSNALNQKPSEVA